MALEGTLSDFSLPDIFQLISLQRKSGILTLRSKNDVISVYFREGNILAADSQQDRIEDRLGYYLLRAKIISEENLNRSLQIQKETLQRLGNILLTYNLVTKEDLQKTLQLVITQKIYRLFRWRDGEYHFDSEAPVEFKDDYFTPIPAQGVLMEAVRMIDEWPMIEKDIPNLDIIFKKTGKFAQIDKAEGKSLSADDLFSDKSDFSDLFGEKDSNELGSEEDRVMRFVDGVRTVKDVMLDAQMTDFDTCNALASLLKSNYIEPLERFKVDKKAEWLQSAADQKEKAPIGRFLTPVLFLICLASLVMMNFNKFNLHPIFPPNDNEINRQYMKELALNKMQRVATAVSQYFYAKSSYPQNLTDLINEGYLNEKSLQDPWGNRLSYGIDENYFIVVSSGDINSDIPKLSITEKLFQ